MDSKQTHPTQAAPRTRQWVLVWVVAAVTGATSLGVITLSPNPYQGLWTWWSSSSVITVMLVSLAATWTWLNEESVENHGGLPLHVAAAGAFMALVTGPVILGTVILSPQPTQVLWEWGLYTAAIFVIMAAFVGVTGRRNKRPEQD